MIKVFFKASLKKLLTIIFNTPEYSNSRERVENSLEDIINEYDEQKKEAINYFKKIKEVNRIVGKNKR